MSRQTRLVTTFFVAAIPFAACGFLTTGARFSSDRIEAVLTGIAVGFVFAAPIVAVLFPFRNWNHFPPVVRFTIPLFVAVGSGIIALTIHFRSAQLPLGSWVRVPDPPERPQAFVGPSCVQDYGPSLFISSGDSVYSYNSSGSRPKGWLKEPDPASSLDSYSSSLCAIEPIPPRTTPMLSGQIIATTRVQDFGADCGGDFYYALLGDGSIWKWGTGSCSIGEFFLTIATFVWGALTGLIASLVFITRKTEKAPKSSD